MNNAGRLDLPSTEAAAHICTCVFECNVPLLRRFIKAGIAVNSGNFDKRTAVHVAAAEGNLAAVRIFYCASSKTRPCFLTLGKQFHPSIKVRDLRVADQSLDRFLPKKLYPDKIPYTRVEQSHAAMAQ